MINRLIKIGLAILILIGFYLLYKSIFIDTALDKTNPLNISNIPTQIFKINTDRDTVIESKHGSLLIIRRNSLTDCQGNIVSGFVEVHLKEIKTPIEIVKSGISTMSNDNFLATDGMFNLQLYKDNEALCLTDSKTISLITKTDSLDGRMKYFVGTENGNLINWIKPTNLVTPNNDSISVVEELSGDWNQDEISYTEALKIGLISRDTIKSPHFDSILSSYYDSITKVWKLENRLNNILEVTTLGWINIDRFIEQNETTPVEFSIKIADGKVYRNIFPRLIFTDINTYLSGYRMNDSKIVFGKNNSEEVRLPLGKEAKLLVTCHLNKKVYYHYSKIIIKDKQSIEVNLKQAAFEDLDILINSEFN